MVFFYPYTFYLLKKPHIHYNFCIGIDPLALPGFLEK